MAPESVVRYTDLAVLAPVPGHLGQHPGAGFITLITCTPVTLAFTPWRVVVTGTLVRSPTRASISRTAAGNPRKRAALRM